MKIKKIFLDYVREKEGLTRSAIARSLGVSVSAYYNMLYRGTELKKKDYAKIAGKLNINIDKLIDYDKEFTSIIVKDRS